MKMQEHEKIWRQFKKKVSSYKVGKKVSSCKVGAILLFLICQKSNQWLCLVCPKVSSTRHGEEMSQKQSW